MTVTYFKLFGLNLLPYLAVEYNDNAPSPVQREERGENVSGSSSSSSESGSSSSGKYHYFALARSCKFIVLVNIVNNLFIMLYSVQIRTMVVPLEVDHIQIVHPGLELI